MNNDVVVRNADDVLQLINSGRVSTRRFWLITMIALGGVFVDFYDLGSLSIGAVQLKTEFHLTAAALGLLTAAAAGGAIVGGLVGGYYTDKVGRLKMFLIDLMLFVVGAGFSAVAPNYDWLFICRIFIGLGIGLDIPVALAFIAEYNALKRKGRSVNTWQMFATGSAVLTYLAITPVYLSGVGDNLWRYALGFGAIPAAIILILRFIYMNESPMWLAKAGNLSQAAKVLSQTSGLNIVLDKASFRERLVPAKHSVKEFGRLFIPERRLRTVLIIILAITEATEYFAIGFYTPTIIVDLFGPGLLQVLLLSAAISGIGFLGAWLCVLVTQRWGLRKIDMVGYTVTLASLLLVGVFGHVMPALVAALIIALFNAGHQFGPGTIAASMGSLSYPTAIRGISGGFTQAMIRVGSMLGFFLFPVLLASFQLYSTVLIIAIAPALGLLSLWIIRWEPLGRDIEAEDFGDRQVEMAGVVTPPGY